MIILIPTRIPITHVADDGNWDAIRKPAIRAATPLARTQPQPECGRRRKAMMISRMPSARNMAATIIVSVTTPASGKSKRYAPPTIYRIPINRFQRKPRQLPAENACTIVIAPVNKKIHPSTRLAAMVDKKGKAIATTPPSRRAMPRTRYQPQCFAIWLSTSATASCTCCRVSAMPALIADCDMRSAMGVPSTCALHSAHARYGTAAAPDEPIGRNPDFRVNRLPLRGWCDQ